MDDADATNPRLEQLEARWEADKGSRVFLQLADEYRRHDRPAEAVRVLDEGLERSPGHLGARVARARSLLDLGRTGDAVADLQRVIDVDPTQMVAYKLLVEAHIERGDAEAAEESLRIYRMLNDADPAIDELRRRIAALDGAPASEDEPAVSAGPAEPSAAEEPEEPRPEPEGEPTAMPAEPPAATAEEAETPFPEAPLPEAGATAGGGPEPPALATGASEPFPALGSGADRRRYLEAFEGELFAPVPGAAPQPGPEAPPTERGPEPFELAPADSAAGAGEPFDLGQPSTPPAAGDLLELEPPAPAPEPPAEPGEDRPTVTLARLYQRQGHLEEAAEMFRRVLERDPEHEEARRGLTEVKAEVEAAEEEAPAPAPGPPSEPAARELRAEELLAGYEPAEHGEGPSARKRYALGRYLDLLRGGGEGRNVH